MDRLVEILEQMELPLAYRQFKSPPKIPFLVYLFNNSDNFSADDRVFSKINNYQIELYTEIKDLELEEKLEDLLDKNEIFYNKYETYIETEDLFLIVYDIGF